jgi:solute carrier family 35 protein E3
MSNTSNTSTNVLIKSGTLDSNSGVSYGTILSMALNFFASVGIITVNKMVFKQYGFTYSTLLTGIHFLATFVGLLICSLIFGIFEIKLVEMKHILALSCSFVGFVTFNNLSLQYNSVGFYQLMKVLTAPAIVFIQLFVYQVPLHWK